jgi:hypothetical protein
MTNCRACQSPLEPVQTQDIAAELEESDTSRRLSFNDSFMEYAPTLISSIKLSMFGVKGEEGKIEMD